MSDAEAAPLDMAVQGASPSPLGKARPDEVAVEGDSPFPKTLRQSSSVRLRQSSSVSPGSRRCLLYEAAHGTPPKRISIRSYEQRLNEGYDELSKIQSASRTGELPYWQQGDEALETPDMVEQRRALRQHPEVIETIEVWWSTAQRSLEQEGRTVDGLSHDRYVLMSTKMYKAMMREYDEEEARASAEADWEEDSAGEALLSKRRFFDAIFELADLWTFEIDAREYVASLWGLTRTRALTLRLLS